MIFSPTVASDEKWDYVKELPLLADNVALKKWIKELEIEDENKVVQPRSKGQALQGLVNPEPLLDKRIPEECFYSEYDEETLRELLDEQMTMVRALKSHGKSKHLANR